MLDEQEALGSTKLWVQSPEGGSLHMTVISALGKWMQENQKLMISETDVEVRAFNPSQGEAGTSPL